MHPKNVHTPSQVTPTKAIPA
uniref:Uncharacterized protein n=1 Tax=Anopheles quadriannulatus TaxID=34691 RepID=A0A182XST0_ANOQN